MVVSIVGDTTGLNKSLTDSQKKMAAFGVNVAAVTAAVVQLGKVAARSVKEFSDYGSAIYDAGQKTGLSTDSIQEWKFIAEQTGTTLESVTGAVGMMTRGLETNKKMFADLGIELKNADGTFRSTTDIFNDTVSTLSGMTDETERDAAAFKLLGRSAQSLIPILNAGESGIKGMRDEARSLGLILDKETISNADQLGDSMDALKASLTSAKNNMVNDMAPALIKIANGLKDLIERTVSSRKEWEAFVRATKGQVTTQDELTLAIKGTIAARAVLIEQAGEDVGAQTRADIMLQIDANKALESSLRARAKAMASATEANRLGTEAARAKAAADQAAADIASKAAETIQANADKQKEIIALQDEAGRQAADRYGDLIVANAQAYDAIEAKRIEAHNAEMARIDAEKQSRIDTLTFAYNAIGSIIDQAAENEIANIENSTKSEEEKAKLIAQVKRKQAIWDKAQALVDIAVNTAEAITKALPNIFLAGLVGVLGAAQAAFVAAQPLPPLPLADGGIVMPKSGGTLAQIAEAGQPEAVIPLDKLDGMGGQMHLVVNLDSRPLLDKIFDATKNRTVLISQGAVV
jgi:hypothetical protein